MKDRFSLSFKAFYLIYLGAIGSFIPYINTYLEKNAGLSGSQIGLITAISLVLGVCVIPIWGVVGDKTFFFTCTILTQRQNSHTVRQFLEKLTYRPLILFFLLASKLLN